MADLNKLCQMLENIDLLKKDSVSATKELDQLIKQAEKLEAAKASEWAKKVGVALNCGLIEVETKAAETIAELCKVEKPRAVVSTNEVILPLIRLLSASSDQAQIQACRAIGNICFDNNDGRNIVFNNNGLKELVEMLRKSTVPKTNPHLRLNGAGCLHNLIIGQNQIYSKVIEMGTINILCDMLTFNIGSPEAEETAVHIYIILGLLADSASGTALLNEKLCQTTVKILEMSSNGELSELCVELLHSQAEDEEVATCLAKAGLCELLLDLIGKHWPQVDDDETRNLLKMACDLIIIILNGDKSMERVYKDGKGKVFEGLIKWLKSSDDDLQISGVLAMANFARSDKHCIQMVNIGISKTLLEILKKNNSPSAKIRLQHALLSALRNLVIPAPNKSIVLGEGLLAALYPMINISTYPVVFKLLGTLRMVIDGQVKASSELGMRTDVVAKLVEWSKCEDHPGVQGEANRLIAWIVKNSRDRDVIGKMVGVGAVECLVNMMIAEHCVMQIESLLALTLVTAIRGQDSEPHLVGARVGFIIFNMVQSKPQREVFQNLLAFISQLATSSVLRLHLSEYKVSTLLASIAPEDDHKEQILRLATLLEKGIN